VSLKKRKEIEIQLPSTIDDERVDSFLKILELIRKSHPNKVSLVLNWTKVDKISPAGFAILCIIFDTSLEQKCTLRNIYIKSKFDKYPIIQNLKKIDEFKNIPKPSLQNYRGSEFVFSGEETSLNMSFMDEVYFTFNKILNESLFFECKLIINELMQNSVDHSTSERYYLYAGPWDKRNKHFQIGVLDLGVTIPGKLEQKYAGAVDEDFLAMSIKKGITTRRQRPGGLGLYHTFNYLKDRKGSLILISRDAQMRRNFKARQVKINKLKHRLYGTWCFVRFPL